MYWQIEPYHTDEADYCVMRAETEADNKMALEYAQARLEAAWGQLQPGMLASVTIELCKGNMPGSGARRSYE